MKHFVLNITYKCNWDCSFCATDTHSQKDITFEDIKRKLTYIEPNSEVSISGGETGLIDEGILEYILKDLKAKNSKISIMTNGLYLKKYLKFDSYINDYFYHCTYNLIDDIYIPEDTTKIEFMLVVTDETFPLLDEFLTKYSDITFTVFGADKYIVKGQDGTSLSKINSIRLLSKFKDRISKRSSDYLINNVEQFNSTKGDGIVYL